MKEILATKDTKKLLIIKNDKLVYEWFASGWEDSLKPHYTASLAKAIVSGMSLLCAIDEGYIHLDDAVPEPPGILKNRIKLICHEK
jgi:hypothetical protein